MRKKMRHAMPNLIQYPPVKVSVRKRISCFGNSCKFHDCVNAAVSLSNLSGSSSIFVLLNQSMYNQLALYYAQVSTMSRFVCRPRRSRAFASLA